MLTRASLTLACLVLFATAAHAQDGNIAPGRDVAQRYCLGCHGEGAARDPRAPAFTAIANDAARTNASLTTWLLDPHPPMPDIRLSIGEIRDVILYIRSLRTTR